MGQTLGLHSKRGETNPLFDFPSYWSLGSLFIKVSQSQHFSHRSERAAGIGDNMLWGSPFCLSAGGSAATYTLCCCRAPRQVEYHRPLWDCISQHQQFYCYHQGLNLNSCYQVFQNFFNKKNLSICYICKSRPYWTRHSMEMVRWISLVCKWNVQMSFTVVRESSSHAFKHTSPGAGMHLILAVKISSVD